MDSVGDLARSLVLRSNQVRLREQMDTLAIELSTGFKKDPGLHLDGDLTSLTAIDRSLSRLKAFQINTAETTLLTGTMQNTMDEIQQRSETLGQALISAELTPNSGLLDSLSGDARDQLARVLGGLNRTVAGRYLFSGVTTDTAPVMEVDDMMTEVLTAVAGQTTYAGIDAVLDTFFDAGGAYETTVYEGSNTGLSPIQLGENDTADVDIRATEDAFRNVIKPIVMATLAAELTLDNHVKVDMLSSAGEEIMGAQQSLVDLRASLGLVESRVEEASARNSSEITAAQMARVNLVGIDDYETATIYENVRSQLDSLYAITVRSQRLSLAEYF